ncbi:heme-binding protein [Peribacillus sp. NPDC097264]|uniref:heme-binding protein n=1 Tax=Peribacillus sp. NPDC097264 TaxID=3390616 RepID=UPI003D036211
MTCIESNKIYLFYVNPIQKVQVDGECVGGIGVSGGHYTHDKQVCEAIQKTYIRF